MTIKKRFSGDRGKYTGLYRRKFDRRMVVVYIRMQKNEWQIVTIGATGCDLMKVGDICIELMCCEEYRIEEGMLVLVNPDYAVFSEKDIQIVMRDAFEELNCDVEFKD